MVPRKQLFHVVVSLSALMLGETLRPSVGKWNNTFNHMKHSAQDYFCTYFLSHFSHHTLSFSLCRFILSPSFAHAHTLPLQMSTAVNREFNLNPFCTYAQRHSQQMIDHQISRITLLFIPTKTYYYKRALYNYNSFYSELCELTLPKSIFLVYLCMNLGVSDKHTSVPATVQ